MKIWKMIHLFPSSSSPIRHSTTGQTQSCQIKTIFKVINNYVDHFHSLSLCFYKMSFLLHCLEIKSVRQAIWHSVILIIKHLTGHVFTLTVISKIPQLQIVNNTYRHGQRTSTENVTSKPFNSQIQFVILLTVSHTILIMLLQRI